VSEFADVTSIRRRDDQAGYDVDLHPGWSIGGKPNGGYLLAILARGGCDIVGTSHPLAISAHYLRAPSPGPAEVRAEVIRSGRRASTSRASLWQGAKACIDATMTSGELINADPDYIDRPPPSLPPPADCLEPIHPRFSPEIFGHVEIRVDPATSPYPTPSGVPMMRYWFRLRDGAPPDVLSLLLAVDAGPPTVFNLKRYGWAPTVELTVLMRGLPAPGWLRCEARTEAFAGGWFDEGATVWDSTGRLVAQSRQLALAADDPKATPPA
jgi:Thioesterase-like superfamily